MRVAGKHRQYAEEGETHELMSESYSRRSWKGIAIALMVLGAVAAIIALIVVFSGPRAALVTDGTLNLTDVINNYYSPKGFSGAKWVSDNQFIFMNSSSSIYSYDFEKDLVSVLLGNVSWEPSSSQSSSPDTYSPSPSGKYILYSYNQNKHFRYSSNASFNIVDLNSKQWSIHNGSLLQLASWGYKDQLAYVYENNIYYLANVTQPGNIVQVTNDGEMDVRFNGVPDWVYEEEVLGSDSALWWSPDGEYFAFMKFDDQKVKDMHYMEYGNINDVYPAVIDLKYPKPGTPNPTVSVWIFKTSEPSKNATQITGFQYENDYTSAITWANSTTLSVVGGPRVQNLSVLYLCFENKDWACTENSREESPGWVDVKNPLFNKDGSKYFLIKTENDYKHLQVTDVQSKTSTFLTLGNYEVTSIIGYDSDNQAVYYLRTAENGADMRLFYRRFLNSKEGECLSCTWNDCSWAIVNMGTNSKYCALTCSSNQTVPIVRLWNLQNNTQVRVWEDNSELTKRLDGQVLPKYQKYEFDDNGFTIKIRVVVPIDFNPNIRYPAIINVYGGPGSQMITDSWVIDWGTYLASVEKTLYVEVDGRGSGYRGDKLLFQLYKRLGTVEIDDQISAMRYLVKNQSFVDPNRCAIWGWSYGGYAAAMSYAKGNNTFKCGLSVAPVTSWTYYDSVYTERYMLEPASNLENYKKGDVMNYVSNFKDNRFLLLHGTGDDNVHVQQTMMLTKSLNNASVLFNMHLYPDENHSILKSKLHVYRTLQDFLKQCL